MKESDTPRTDQLMHGGCVAINILEHARELERELAISLENQLKTQAEVERLLTTLKFLRDECDLGKRTFRMVSEAINQTDK